MLSAAECMYSWKTRRKIVGMQSKVYNPAAAVAGQLNHQIGVAISLSVRVISFCCFCVASVRYGEGHF